MSQWDTLWINVSLATMDPTRPAAYGAIAADTDGTDAIAVKDGRIAWLGAMEELPTDYESQAVVDGEGRWLTPVRFARGRGLIYWFWIPDIPASTARPVRLCWTAGFSQPTATR
jgi:hypothetical protein